MVVRVAVSFKLIFLSDEKIFIEKEPLERHKLPETNTGM